MPEPYNLTALSHSDGLLNLTQNANTIADGMLGFGILITVYLILFISFKSYDIKKAFAGAGFITSVIAIVLRLTNLITDTMMFGTFIMAALSFVLLIWAGD